MVHDGSSDKVHSTPQSPGPTNVAYHSGESGSVAQHMQVMIGGSPELPLNMCDDSDMLLVRVSHSHPIHNMFVFYGVGL